MALLVALLGESTAQAAVNISDKPTKHMSCSAGVCSPTAKKAVLNATDLANMLQVSDVKLTTGSGALMIKIVSGLSWASANRLTLDANCNVSVKAPVTVAGPGGLTIVTNDGGSGCDLVFFPSGKIDFWDLSSSLVINGMGYTLVNNIKTLASNVASNPSGSYALSGDYDATFDGAYVSSPVATCLTGSFEGLGHTISNLKIHVSRTEQNYVGFFACISGIARDTQLANADIENLLGYARSLAAFAGGNGGTITNVGASGKLIGRTLLKGGLIAENGGNVYRCWTDISISWSSGPSDREGERGVLGGLVGENTGTIELSSAHGPVLGRNEDNIGGLVGGNLGLIDHSNASGAVTGRRYVGALVGYNNGQITNTYATGDVTSSDGDAIHAGGGLAGFNGILISNSFSTSLVNAGTQGNTGGLVGINSGAIENSYASGNPASAQAGGLVGLNDKSAAILSSYSIGHPTASVAGGLIGDDEVPGTGVADYWDLDTSGINDPSQGAGNIANDPGITGLSDAQLKSELPAGFDPAIWGQSPSINNGYPYLLANPPP